jgi:hypothetical protein
VIWCIRQDWLPKPLQFRCPKWNCSLSRTAVPPANSLFEAKDDNKFHHGCLVKCGIRNAKCGMKTSRLPPPANLDSAFRAPHSAFELVGCHGFAPCSRRLRAGTSLSKFATQARHEGRVEPRRPDLWSSDQHRDFAAREMDGHEGSAPFTPVWKTGVCLSTPMPGEMESRAGIAPASAVLQTAA